MTDRSQGPGWWQASDLKWYPPEKHANYVAPLPYPPVMTKHSPSTTKGPSGPRNGGFVVAGLALLLVIGGLVVVIGGLVAGGVLLGTPSSKPSTTRSPAVSGTTPVNTPSAANVIVNGQNLPVDGPTVCNVQHLDYGDLITIQIGDSGYQATLADKGQFIVLEVIVGDIHYLGPGTAITEGLGNSAQAERHGKTYKITGNALSFDSKVSLTDSFEIDATCP
jgi:Mycobacterium 19 kDa lipoprotein antigen